MKKRQPRVRGSSKGFSLIEVLIGIVLIAIAVIGLAHLFLLGVMNNMRSGDISSAVFLAQQQVDYLRTLTGQELMTFPSPQRGESADERIDINNDGTFNYRRITIVNYQDPFYDIQVLVFPASRMDTETADLLADPSGHKVKAQVHTLIGR